MWKCSACSKYNVKMQTAAVFASNLTANVCLMLANLTLYDLFSKPPNYFSRWLSTSFLEIVFSRKSLFHFFVVVLYYTFLQG